MIWILAFTLGWFALTSFFWLRGIYRNNRTDQILGMVLLLSFGVTAILLDSTTYLLNDVGFCTIALGALTIVVGLAGKRISSAQVYSSGFLLAVFGLFLALLL